MVALTNTSASKDAALLRWVLVQFSQGVRAQRSGMLPRAESPALSLVPTEQPTPTDCDAIALAHARLRRGVPRSTCGVSEHILPLFGVMAALASSSSRGSVIKCPHISVTLNYRMYQQLLQTRCHYDYARIPSPPPPRTSELISRKRRRLAPG